MPCSIEQIRRDVEALALPHGRSVGSEGHAAARQYLITRIENLGMDFYAGAGFEWPYQESGQPFTNILARVPGGVDGQPPLLLAAHYDTCGPFPGADDNAAALAILLAAGEQLRGHALTRPVVLAFFDAEEPPYYLTPSMGSIHFYQEQRLEAIHGAIVLDLCGHDLAITDMEDLLFITGMESDPALEHAVRACEPGEELRIIPTLNRYVGDLSDHHVFRIHQQPYLFLSCGRWEHYHQPSDTPEKLNYGKTAAIAGLVCALTADLAERRLEGPFESTDPVEAELYFLRKAAGPLLDMLGFNPKTRADLDFLVKTMIVQLGLAPE